MAGNAPSGDCPSCGAPGKFQGRASDGTEEWRCPRCDAYWEERPGSGGYDDFDMFNGGGL